MRKPLRLLVALAMMATVGFLRASQDDDKEQLKDLELHCAAALVDGDVQWLASFYDLDWILIGSDGRRFTRRQTLAQLGNGEVKWRSCAMSEMDIRVFGDTAIVVYKAAAVGEVHGAKIVETEVCTDAFIRVDGRWRCIHSHNSMLP